MKRTILPTFLNKRLNFELPRKWGDLTQEQLRYVYFVMSAFPQIAGQTYIFFRLLGIRVHHHSSYGWLCSVRLSWRRKVKFFMQDFEIMFWQKHLNWLYSPNDTPARLERIGHFRAVSSTLHGLTFEEYLECENCYQGYLYSKNPDALKMMAERLYTEVRPWWHPWRCRQHFKDFELFSIFMWWSAVKLMYSKQFPDFFRQVEVSDQRDIPDMMAIMNAQIRALTGGDVTKESRVLNMDCWRALTELNEKAREIREAKEKQQRRR